MARCVFNSTDLKDIEYIFSEYYNKAEFARFSSSVGKFVGYTEWGLKNAEFWNNDASVMAQARGEKERYCLNNVGLDYQAALTKSGEFVFLFKQHQIIMLLINVSVHQHTD